MQTLLSVNTFLSYSKCSKCLSQDFMYCVNLFLKCGAAFSAENFCFFSSATFNSETVFGLEQVSKQLHTSLPGHDICRGFKFQVRWPLFLLNYLQFACRHCWATCAVCTEPHASHWICCSVWQQSAAVFNKFWKHKLINSFNYYLQNISTNLFTLQWHHCRVKLVLLFVEINENWVTES